MDFAKKVNRYFVNLYKKRINKKTNLLKNIDICSKGDILKQII